MVSLDYNTFKGYCILAAVACHSGTENSGHTSANRDKMAEWITWQFYVFFNSISVISGCWENKYKQIVL